MVATVVLAAAVEAEEVISTVLPAMADLAVAGEVFLEVPLAGTGVLAVVAVVLEVLRASIAQPEASAVAAELR